jgi:hypothetical protein
VEIVVHAIQVSKFRELMATYKPDASSAPDSANRRTELLKALGLESFSAQLEVLAKALGGITKPAPAPSPAPINPDLAVFRRACDAVGIEAYKSSPTSQIGGRTYTTPAEAIIAQLDDSVTVNWIPNFSSILESSNFSAVSDILGFCAMRDCNNADYALQGVANSEKMNDFRELLIGYRMWRRPENENAHSAAITRFLSAFGASLNPAINDTYLGAADLKKNRPELSNAISVLNTTVNKFIDFKFADFVVAQAGTMMKLVMGNAKIDPTKVAMPKPIGGVADKYKLGDLINAIGGDGDCGIKLEADAANADIGATVAKEFINQVHTFRTNHQAALYAAKVTVAGSLKTLSEAYEELYRAEIAMIGGVVEKANADYEAAKAKFPEEK